MVRRDNTQRRRAGYRQARNRLLIICCGAKTEKRYLEGMRRHFRDAPVSIEVRCEVGAPSQIVDYARKRWQRDPDGFDEVWCVFDVDDFHEDVHQAVAQAARAKIRLAISNPCFEFWLILHFVDHTAWLAGAKDAVAVLSSHLPCYDKTKISFDSFLPGLPAAIERARCNEDHRRNPSTTMGRLAAVIADVQQR